LIDARRLHALMAAFVPHGGTADGGMHRLTLSAEDGAARDHLARWMRDRGLKLTVDTMGNMVGLLDWAGPDAPVVMTGSHLDSQPRGGRFDGAYGVLAACEAVEAVRGHMEAGGRAPRCNLAIVNWTNEEGARFQPSLLGSSVYTGLLEARDALGRKDGDGVTVAEALAAIGYDGTGRVPYPQAYVELHVECGSVLEQAGERFGTITRHWGAVKYRLAFIGRQAHTGPTPMSERQDALLGAAHLITAIGALPGQAAGTLLTSVGRLEVQPNSPNVVPGEAVMFIELRSPEQSVLDWAEREMLAAADAAALRVRVRHETRFIDRRGVGFFDEGLVALASDVAAGLGVGTMRLDTIAAHDGICMIPICPSIVINVPSVGGVCHHPSEFTTPEDLELGAEVLARMLHRLCDEGLGALGRPA
jgi:beta-ureidopropionase / N-carbamoyl-L-amino-acid hydrolase